MILKNAMEITFARVEFTSSELEISFPIHLCMLIICHYLPFVNRFSSISVPFAAGRTSALFEVASFSRYKV